MVFQLSNMDMAIEYEKLDAEKIDPLNLIVEDSGSPLLPLSI